MSRALWLLVAASVVVAACDQGVAPPTLTLDTPPACDVADTMCVREAPSLFEVDGVRVLYQHVTGHPLVAFRVLFDAQDEPRAAQFWAESLALSVLAQAGSEAYDSASWNAQLTKLEASLYIGGGTDYRSIVLGVARTSWSPAWNLLMDAVERPSTNEYYLENRRAVAAYGYDSAHDEASSAASVEAFSRLFRGGLMNRGREGQPALHQVSSSDLEEAWRGMRTKDRLLVSVVGDISEREVREVVSTRLGKFPRHYAPTFSDVPLDVGPEERVAVLPYPDSPTWHIYAYVAGPAADAPDYSALELGIAVLDERLFDQVRDVEGLAYTTGASLSFYRQSYGSVWLSTTAPERALPIVRSIVAALKSEGPDSAELVRARQTLRAAQLEQAETPAGLAYELADWQLTVADYRYGDAHLAALESATPDAVAAALRAYLTDAAVVAAGSDGSLREADLASLLE